ncbi:MAG: CRISPR-associated endonuclease Cas4g/Cas1g, partial [Terriglobia bacterium]
MGALPAYPERPRRDLPDYLPARMVNEFVYCPRLFFYEWVDGVFRESVDTVEGKFQHKRVDAKASELPKPDAVGEEKIESRSVTLSSEEHRVIAKIDLVEAEGGLVTPVDYKHGRPKETDAGLELWPSDRIQLAVQGLVLRENGYRCEEGVAYYVRTRQRVRVAFDAELMREAGDVIARAWKLARAGEIPPPLEDSPKCPGCSLVGICLPDETNSLRGAPRGAIASWPGSQALQLDLFEELAGAGSSAPEPAEARQLVTPRDDLRPLYLNVQGLRVGKSGNVLQMREKDELKQEVRIGEICQVNLMGNVQVSTQAIQSLCEAAKPICYFSQGGWFYGITTGLNSKNIFLRRAQFRLAGEEWFQLALARRLVAGKIRNQRTMLQRNHLEPGAQSLMALKQMCEQAERAASLEQLLGIEGNGARIYFADFAGMIKLEPNDDGDAAQFRFDFAGRNRRPPRDAVNAMLSLGYSLLAKDFTIACYAVGFDPYMGFYHQPRFG